jgi:GNAT superfamily N-acetyltransferase
MIIEPAQIEDAADILALLLLDYRHERETYGGFPITLHLKTAEEVRHDLLQHLWLKATEEGKIAGAVSAHMHDASCEIRHFVVHPDFEGRGIGPGLMREIEERFPTVSTFWFVAGYKTRRKIRLLKRIGYKTRSKEIVSEKLKLLSLEKRV